MPSHAICRFVPLFALALLLLGCNAVQADEPSEPINVAILTGQNNHAWMMDTPVLENILDEAGIFETTILQTPDRNAENKAELWAAFDPDFSSYDVIVFNYNGEDWPDHLKESFVAYVRGGGKVYSFHAGNNPFRGWEEFEQMIGLLWRNNNGGRRLFFDADGNAQFEEPGQGRGAGHGRQHAYVVETREDDHPIFAGLPDRWMHAQDELYHGQRGPAENMTVLLTAFSDSDTGGTGVTEAIAWTIPFGDGLVLTNVMGHWWRNQQMGPALQCAGFQTVFTRSVEWLATGEVTIPVPDDFPNAEEVSLRELAPYEPLAYIYVPGVPGSDPLASCDCSIPTNPLEVPAWAQHAGLLAPLHEHDAASR